jgi:hypothetical protein
VKLVEAEIMRMSMEVNTLKYAVDDFATKGAKLKIISCSWQ